MSNPLYSCMVSDPSFPPEPSACAVGPPKSTTPGQYRRELPGHASEQVLMGPPRGVIFRIWSTEMLEALIGGTAKIASSLTALLGPQALDSGLAQARIRIARAPRSFGPIQRQPGPASTAGLRDGQTLATWIALDAADVPPHSSWRAIRSQDRKAARVLLVCRLSRFAHGAACPASRTSAMRAPALSTRKTFRYGRLRYGRLAAS